MAKVTRTYSVVVEHEDTLLNPEILIMEAVDNHMPAWECKSVTSLTRQTRDDGFREAVYEPRSGGPND